MPLEDVSLLIGGEALPADVRAFLREADRRIRRFRRHTPLPGFIPSDYERAYHMLRAVTAADLVPGHLFCEWGSGFGVVACLASMLDFEACGIEIEGRLVDAARELAADFDLPVEFVRDSFIPPGGEAYLGGDPYAWLETEEGGAGDELGLSADDFDVTFAYPWPDEVGTTLALFDCYGGAGSLLVTYHGADDFQVRRKVGHGPARDR